MPNIEMIGLMVPWFLSEPGQEFKNSSLARAVASGLNLPFFLTTIEKKSDTAPLQSLSASEPPLRPALPAMHIMVLHGSRASAVPTSARLAKRATTTVDRFIGLLSF
uniref:Uncharacterized protein n=1 Tax=Pseudomonas monteilii TaxID=76759 RepID=A0A6H1Q6N3_9PSED|nr:Hypothetical protein [Pseudomonas monteilii]